MEDWNQLKTILDNKKFSNQDQQLLHDFLMSFSFQKRQQLMGIFSGFPEKVSLFTDLLKKKVAFAKNLTEALAGKILEMESKEMQDLMKEIG